jgi:hypothetical protein
VRFEVVTALEVEARLEVDCEEGMEGQPEPDMKDGVHLESTNSPFGVKRPATISFDMLLLLLVIREE